MNEFMQFNLILYVYEIFDLFSDAKLVRSSSAMRRENKFKGMKTI